MKSRKVTTVVFSALFAALSIGQTADAAQVHVRVDKQQVRLNENFKVVFEYDGNDARPDWRRLREHFHIVGQNQRQRKRTVNGVTTQWFSWTLNLRAKREGKLRIPPIAFGKTQSAAKDITVKRAPPPANKKAPPKKLPDFYIEIDATPAKAYVQQEIHARVRVFMLHSVRGSLSPLKTTRGRAIIKTVSNQGKNYRVKRGNRQYQVYEMAYLVYPQASGRLAFGGIDLKGTYVKSGRRHSVRKKSPDRQVEILPAAAAYKGGKWLPAKEVKLSAWLSHKEDEMQIGKPFTRTIRIAAKGVLDSQLPTLTTDIAGVKTYINQPNSGSRIEKESLVATRDQKIVMIPTAGGELILPEMQVPWWNTQKNAMETAVLPTKTLAIADASIDSVLTLETPVSFSDDDLGAAASGASEHWIWASAILGSLWLMTGAGWAWQLYTLRRRRVAASKASKAATQTVRAARRKLQAACEANDGAATKRALLDWARALGAPANNLLAIGERFGGDVATQIAILNNRLYSNRGAVDREGDKAWDGAALWAACADMKRVRGEPTTAGPSAVLKPLYPNALTK